MKVAAPVVQVVEVENEGFASMLGHQVEIISNVYIYTGIVAGVNDVWVKLDNAAIVYETGSVTDGSYKDYQNMPTPLYVTFSSMESFRRSNKKYPAK